jgi:starch synthase
MTYFLENMEYYEKRANVYGYNDDTARWLLLSRGVIEFVKRSEWKPDIIVANDWQTGFIPNIIKVECKDDPVLSKIVTVFTIHNLRYQGLFNPFFINEIDYDSGQGPIPDFLDENIWKLNGIRRGILYADAVSTVSPTYSKEILDPKFGEKLEEVLQQKRARLFGILNGIDYDFFNPANDNQIASPFSEDSLKERSLNKTALQKKVGLPENADKFVMSFVGRLDEQKGIALLRSISDALFENLNFDLIILGTGDNDYKFYFQELQKKYPDRVSVCLYFDPDLPKLIFAGSDAVLVPSLFEPSGLVQMEAMRYGCIPIVRKVGGLADSVKDYSPDKEEGTGFVFEKYDQLAFLIAIVRAMEAYRNKKEWTKLIKRAMTEDFSWAKSAKEYLKLFETAIKFHE